MHASRLFVAATYVFVHAHPDDEAIFTGATMRLLADAGCRVVLVCATGGELGEPLAPLAPGESMAARRLGELEEACAALGVARLVPVGYRDSGLPGWASNDHPRAFCRAATARAGRWLADLCEREGAEAVVSYDPRGIYPHPDHVQVHEVGAAAVARTGVTSYQATVDRQHLRESGPHLLDLGSAEAEPTYGCLPDQIDLTVPAGPALPAKRAAMAAHASQIPAATLTDARFDATYGLEWYLRSGPVAALDRLAESWTSGLREAG